MKKQKICIIGGNLTGLITAIALSKLNCQIDLITGNVNQNHKSNRTIAISENNLDFLNKLNITKSLKKEMWPCSKMQLYTEIKSEKFSELFEINNSHKEKKIFYMLENSKIMKFMISKIKQIKSISIKSHEKISEITSSGVLKSVKINNKEFKYNLIIICAGNNSNLVKNLFNNQTIEKSYREISITAILNHKSLKNNTARQIFLNNEILALLPISNSKTSIVWSVKDNMKKKNVFLLKKKIKLYAKNYLKNVSFATNIEHRELKFLVRNQYFLDRILLFGDALHIVHPFVGQGFNMTLRDLISLKKILNKKINLGLDIGSSDILSEFSNEIKSGNFAFALGVDFLKNSFSFKKLRDDTLKILNKSNFAKDIFFNVADKGLKF